MSLSDERCDRCGCDVDPMNGDAIALLNAMLFCGVECVKAFLTPEIADGVALLVGASPLYGQRPSVHPSLLDGHQNGHEPDGK